MYFGHPKFSGRDITGSVHLALNSSVSVVHVLPDALTESALCNGFGRNQVLKALQGIIANEADSNIHYVACAQLVRTS